jgi:hypothetical protein
MQLQNASNMTRVAHDTVDAPDNLNLLRRYGRTGHTLPNADDQAWADQIGVTSYTAVFPEHRQTIEAYGNHNPEIIPLENKYAFIRDYMKYTGLDKIPMHDPANKTRLTRPLKTHNKRVHDYLVNLQVIEYFGNDYDRMESLIAAANKFTDYNIKYDAKLNSDAHACIRQYATHEYNKFVKDSIELNERRIHKTLSMEDREFMLDSRSKLRMIARLVSKNRL